jgi:hypothetical protein
MFAITLAAIAALAAAPSPSPSPTPITDPCASLSSIVTRPTFTTSVCTVQPRGILLENGVQNTVATGTGAGYTAAYPQTFVRVGTGDPHVEWNLTPPTYLRSNSAGMVTGGYGDVSLGLKAELGYNARAAWGANAAVSFPMGSQAFTAGGTGYTANFNWTYTVNPVISLAGTLGFDALAGYDANGNAGRYFAIEPTLAVFASLPNDTELFAEYAYFSSSGVGIGGKGTIDVGYERDLSPNVQFDLEYGFTPTPVNGQRSTYTGAGVSFLIGAP